MFVKNFMTNDPIVIAPQASISYAVDLLKTHGLKRLPVVEKSKLVGLVTEADLLKALPSQATALSKHEINYLTSKITISEIMTRNLITTTSDSTAEEAVMLMRQHDVGCLPVLDSNKKLVGIITESNVFEALTKLLGLHQAGLRITIEVTEEIGVIAKLSQTIKDLDITIISLATFATSEEKGTIILRLATNDNEKVIRTLADQGFNILHWTNLH